MYEYIIHCMHTIIHHLYTCVYTLKAYICTVNQHLGHNFALPSIEPFWPKLNFSQF